MLVLEHAGEESPLDRDNVNKRGKKIKY